MKENIIKNFTIYSAIIALITVSIFVAIGLFSYCMFLIPYFIIVYCGILKSIEKKKEHKTSFILNALKVAMFNNVMLFSLIVDGLFLTNDPIDKMLLGIIILEIFVIGISLFGSLFITVFPQKRVQKNQEKPYYAVTDVLLQTQEWKISETSQYIPVNTIKNQPLIFKILVWVFIILLVVIPFSELLPKAIEHFSCIY